MLKRGNFGTPNINFLFTNIIKLNVIFDFQHVLVDLLDIWVFLELFKLEGKKMSLKHLAYFAYVERILFTS